MATSTEQETFTSFTPLVPNDYDSVEEALYLFGEGFKQRYSKADLDFCPISLKMAVREVVDARDVTTRRPLAIYLHNEKASSTSAFVTQVLCDDKVSALLKKEFVVWGWDCTDDEAIENMIEWLEDAQAYDAANQLECTPVDDFPLLLVLQRQQGALTMTDMISGKHNQTADFVLPQLKHSVAIFEKTKSAFMAKERARVERQQLQAQQEAEYEASKKQDRLKYEAAKEQERLKMEEEARIAKEERKAKEAALRAAEEAKRRHEELAAAMPEEPKPDDKNVITIRLRFPDNAQTVRRFSLDEPLQLLIDFAGSKGYLSDQYCIFSSDFPRKNIATFDSKTPFSELKWSRREQVIVEEI
uniref:UBX domain-containing protein n=1 Tax=Panagrellus redivivus TaxID=6233 RepID=A0A7E4UUK2_PANRE